MSSGGIQPGDERVPAADATANILSKQVVGNKADAAVTTVGTTASLVAYLKGVINLLGAAGIDDVVIPIGPIGNAVIQRDVDSAVRYAVYLVNLAGDILTDAETVPGTHTVHRVRAGSDTEITASTASTELNGVISAVVDFTSGADWDEGDLGYVEFTGITATVGGITTEMPIMRKSFRVSQEFDIEGKIDTVDANQDVPAQDVVTNLLTRDVLGNKTDTAATGAVTATESVVAYLKQVVTELAVVDAFHDVPGVGSSDNNQMRDVLGNKTDAAALGGVSTTESVIAYLKSVVNGLGLDGTSVFNEAFDEANFAGAIHGFHGVVHILFVIPEAVGAINADNAAILVQIQKLGRVHTITQGDALNYPHFQEYNVIVLGQNTTAWNTANLAHVKASPGHVICVDDVAADFLQMGTSGGDAAAKTVLVAVSQIESTMLGLGSHAFVGLAAGNNTIAASGVTFNTLDMSDADITETFYATETVADNTDVLLGVIYKEQPDGSAGVGEDAVEIEGTRMFYGPGFSFNSLNTLGQEVFAILVEMGVHAGTTGAKITLAGDIGQLQTKMFGNQASEFNNGNPMVEYLSGRNSSGTKLPVGESLYDQHLVPSADGTGNVEMTDVVGNKTDAAAAGSVSATESQMAYLKQLITMQKRAVHRMDFKSTTIDPVITLNATAADEALPSVTMTDLPSGAVILKVEAWVSIGEFEDTSAAENSLVLAGTEHIQVKETAGGSFTDAIKLVAAQWLTGASLHRGGGVYFGSIDIKAEVDANDTYDFQIENADVTGASLLLRDVQTGLIVWFTLE